MHLTVILVVQLNWDTSCEANETKYLSLLYEWLMTFSTTMWLKLISALRKEVI